MLKTLAAQIKEFKTASLVTPLFMIGEVVAEMLIPLLMTRIVDNGVGQGDFNYVVKVGLCMLLVALGGLVCGLGGAFFGSRASAGFARNLRQAMYENIQTFSFSNVDKYSTAGLVTRMTTDVTNVQQSYMMILRMCFRAPVSLVVAMIMAFSISSRLSMIFLVALVFLGLVIAFLVTHAMGLFNQVFRRYDDLNASVQENVSAIRVVKAYVREDHEERKFKKASGNLYDLFVKAESMVVLNMPMMQATVYACILALSWFGARMIVVGDLSTGSLMGLFTYCMNILTSLMMISMIFVMITMSKASAERIAEVLQEKADLTSPENAVTTLENGSIEFDHVEFAYRKNGKLGRPVLSDIDLRIEAGETIGIIGGTGSSKSSLVQLIPRLYDVTGGAVRVSGRNVKEYDLDTLRSSVAMVLQKNTLFSGTIYDNLRWGNENATDEECQEACRMACADEFISKMPKGYDTYIEQGGTNVSGGQKQRLCIARALLKNPKVLILDDSTSAVDTATDASIRQAFAEKLPGITKIIIAQRISSVADADRIIVLDKGRIDAFDTHENLLRSNAIYRDIEKSQRKGEDDHGEE